MPNPQLPIRIRTNNLGRNVLRAYRSHAERGRARREHDFVIQSDHRFAVEHRAQVHRSIELGRGGCPYCDTL